MKNATEGVKVPSCPLKYLALHFEVASTDAIASEISSSRSQFNLVNSSDRK